LTSPGRPLRGGIGLAAGLALLAGLGGGAGCAPRTPPSLRPELADRYPVHVVEPGENLYRIAQAHGVRLEDLQALNEIEDPTSLRVGQRLLIPKPLPPPPMSEPVEPSPSPPAEHDRCPSKLESLAISRYGLSWPVDGVVLARFGEVDGAPHPGIDLGAPIGAPIYASQAGRVTFAGTQPGFGRVVILEHGPGAFTLYARNDENCVETGQRVQRGQVIGHVGDAGGTGVPYVYFEVREDGRPVDPQPRLPR